MAGELLRRVEERLNQFATFTVDVIYDRRKDLPARILGGFLWCLSLIFKVLSVGRLQLYRQRILRAQHLGCLVIVVGNLTVGGTGKTPIVEKLARALLERGRKVAILSRGYKSRKEPLWRKWWRLITHTPAPPPRVVSDGQQVLLDSETAGDEPYMLARNLLPGVLVITDKDRVKAGQFAIRKFGVDTLILDDGFQYFQLKDHIQLLLIDKSNPFGNGQLLPRGILREPVEHLRRASYVFLTKSDGKPDPALLSTIERHRPGTEVIECTHEPKYLQTVNGDKRLELKDLRGKKVAAMSGIAVPESFEDFLKKFGAELALRFRFLDHHRFTAIELERVFERARSAGVDYLVTTEKDAVRIPESIRAPIPFYYLRVEIEWLAGEDDFDKAVSRISADRRIVE
ncbi:MAG: tetraacyldisaccharide 4'-kinase [Opitutales bacterium]|nr:tetraacyldisaccharide 4'-kinase [Opitutales bacterium]